MKNNLRLKGQFRIYMRWPLVMIAPLVGINIWFYLIERQIGLIMTAVVAFYILCAVLMYLYSRSQVLTDLIHFSIRYRGIQNTLLKKIQLPYLIVLEDGRILWKNDSFLEITEDDKKEKYIFKMMPELNTKVFPSHEDTEVTLELSYRGRTYQAILRKVLPEVFQDSEKVQEQFPEEAFIAIYLNDLTELNSYIQAIEDKHLVAGLIYVDNYDEVMENMEEMRQPLLMALVERKIGKYISDVDGLVRKIENDKYFVVMRNESYRKLCEDQFSILEGVKQINAGNTRSVTLCIGLGVNFETYGECYHNGRLAIDLGLARGGDQVVIKDHQDIYYYGGKNEQMARNTRVKARVKAEALREVLESKDVVIVMGHKAMDADVLGACMGIYRCAAPLGKKVHIIVNDVISSIRPLYDEIVQDATYGSDLFVSSKRALDYPVDSVMLVVVDTNKPYLTECPELLQRFKTVAVLDHHRQDNTVIENTVLSYIEPYSSSVSEMVVEMMQYIVPDIKFPILEANCLYAGIMIDTRNFMNRTGVRTFEAAAFLRRHGADITRVRKMFRDDMASYQAKAQAIRMAEVYRSEYAIAESPSEIANPVVLAAQAANELLDISGIKASFVVTIFDGKVHLSARSIDEVNVQIICEKLGGGGHINSAGAQFSHNNVSKAIFELKETIDTMIEKGEI